VGLPDGCSDSAYLEALDQALEQASNRFSPDFLIYLAGADVHEGDRLGRLKLTEAGMVARDQRVFDCARDKKIPMIICMGGGYGHDLETTVAVQMNTWRLAHLHWLHWQNRGF
jgi:acetoin utilization deacetylase AcuC-like enzyme